MSVNHTKYTTYKQFPLPILTTYVTWNQIMTIDTCLHQFF